MPYQLMIAATFGTAFVVAGKPAAGADAREAALAGNHAGRERQMPAGRFTAEDDLVDVDVVVLGLTDDETEGALRVFHRRRRQRHAGHPVFDVHHVPAHFEPRHERT